MERLVFELTQTIIVGKKTLPPTNNLTFKILYHARRPFVENLPITGEDVVTKQAKEALGRVIFESEDDLDLKIRHCLQSENQKAIENASNLESNKTNHDDLLREKLGAISDDLV